MYSFTSVLLQSLVVLAPWPSNTQMGAVLVVGGIGEFTYRIREVLIRRRLHLKAIRGPIDWVFHNAVPVAAGVSLIAGGAGFIAGAAFAPSAVAGSSSLFLVSGIYRCWGETLALITTRADS